MPLYSDMYHSYLGNLPSFSTYNSQLSTSQSTSQPSYSLSSFTSPYIPSVRVVGVSRFLPKLTTISETPLSKHRLAAFTRIHPTKPSTITRRQSPKYVPPRPRRMDTSDIDVSSSRFAHKKFEEPLTQIKQIAIKDDSNDEENPLKIRSTIRRDRGLVRLRTIRMPANEEKRQETPPKDNIQKTSNVEVDHGYGSSERSSGSWRKKLEMDLAFANKPLSPTAKTLGESFIEKYHIKDEREKSPEVKVFFTLDDVPLENRDFIRRQSSGLLPTFKDICSDISSDKLTDDLNAGELRRRASLIIEEEMNKLMNSDSGPMTCVVESQIMDDEKANEEKQNRKVKKIRQKVTANTSADNPAEIQLKNSIEEVKIKEISTSDQKVLTLDTPVDKNTAFKVPLNKKKKLTDAEGIKNTCDTTMSSTLLTTVSADEKKTAKTIVNAPPESLINNETKHTADPNKKLLIEKNATTAPNEHIKTQKKILKTNSLMKLEVSQPEVPKMNPLRKDPSADDFWGMIGSRETTIFATRKQRVIEDQQQKIYEVAWTKECEEDEKKILEEKTEKLAQILETKGEKKSVKKLTELKIENKCFGNKNVIHEGSKKEPTSKVPMKTLTKDIQKAKVNPAKLLNKKEVTQLKEPIVELLTNEAVEKKESVEKLLLKSTNQIKQIHSGDLSKNELIEKKEEKIKLVEEKINVAEIEPTTKVNKTLPLSNLSEALTQKADIKPADQKSEKISHVTQIVEIKSHEKTIEQKPATKRLFGKAAAAKAPIEKISSSVQSKNTDFGCNVNANKIILTLHETKVNDQDNANSLNTSEVIEREAEIKEIKVTETSKVINETTQSLGTLVKFPTLNNLNSISMNDENASPTTTDDNRELSSDTITVAADRLNENEKLVESKAEQISIVKELSETTSTNNYQNKAQEKLEIESESEHSSYEESSEEEEEDMGKKDFDPQKKVKIDFTKMQKFFKTDEKSNIKLVARPRPLWKIKRNRHAKFSSSSESSDEEVEEIVGGGSNDSVTSGSQSSASSDKIPKKNTNILLKARVKSRSDAQNENIVALMQLLNVNENDNDDEVKKKSRFSTSSQDSGYSGMSGATAARSPRKALGECKNSRFKRKVILKSFPSMLISSKFIKIALNLTLIELIVIKVNNKAIEWKYFFPIISLLSNMIQ